MSKSTVSYLWREPQVARDYATGVSLHSHTSHSVETLNFIADLTTEMPMIKKAIQWAEDRCYRCSGIKVDYEKCYWTPPLNPRQAFELERNQIENAFQIPGLVSISDHDDITAPMLLRALPAARNMPISTEWSVPYSNPSAVQNTKPTAFHLGIHNLPAENATEWNARLNAFTEMPLESRPANLLGEILGELHELPNVLVIFNHPLWDLYRIGNEAHEVLANDFLAKHGQFIHALELNGLRNWTENQKVHVLARQWNQLVISGGDRHGIEPNANINLTQAGSFNEFVNEVRKERISNVLFMPQYKQPWKHRILESTLDAIRNYPNFPESSQRWDQRVFAPNRAGEIRPISELWAGGEAGGKVPVYLAILLGSVRLLGRAPVSGSLKLAWNDRSEMRAALTQQDA